LEGNSVVDVDIEGWLVAGLGGTSGDGHLGRHRHSGSQ
jgi:hypothetical protein